MSKTWKNEYLKNLNDPNTSYYELGEKIEKYRPTKLYKYMRFDDYWRKNIFEGQLFFSPTSMLNDPYDCLVYLNRKVYSKYILKKLQIQFPTIDMHIPLHREINSARNGITLSARSGRLSARNGITF